MEVYMKPTLHSIVFKFTINRLRNYIMSDAGIYDLSDNYKYKKIGCIDFSYLNPCGVEILHFLGRYNVTLSAHIVL